MADNPNDLLWQQIELQRQTVQLLTQLLRSDTNSADIPLGLRVANNRLLDRTDESAQRLAAFAKERTDQLEKQYALEQKIARSAEERNRRELRDTEAINSALADKESALRALGAAGRIRRDAQGNLSVIPNLRRKADDVPLEQFLNEAFPSGLLARVTGGGPQSQARKDEIKKMITATAKKEGKGVSDLIGGGGFGGGGGGGGRGSSAGFGGGSDDGLTHILGSKLGVGSSVLNLLGRLMGGNAWTALGNLFVGHEIVNTVEQALAFNRQLTSTGRLTGEGRGAGISSMWQSFQVGLNPFDLVTQKIAQEINTGLRQQGFRGQVAMAMTESVGSIVNSLGLDWKDSLDLTVQAVRGAGEDLTSFTDTLRSLRDMSKDTQFGVQQLTDTFKTLYTASSNLYVPGQAGPTPSAASQTVLNMMTKLFPSGLTNQARQALAQGLTSSQQLIAMGGGNPIQGPTPSNILAAQEGLKRMIETTMTMDPAIVANTILPGVGMPGITARMVNQMRTLIKGGGWESSVRQFSQLSKLQTGVEPFLNRARQGKLTASEMGLTGEDAKKWTEFLKMGGSVDNAHKMQALKLAEKHKGIDPNSQLGTFYQDILQGETTVLHGSLRLGKHHNIMQELINKMADVERKHNIANESSEQVIKQIIELKPSPALARFLKDDQLNTQAWIKFQQGRMGNRTVVAQDPRKK